MLVVPVSIGTTLIAIWVVVWVIGRCFSAWADAGLEKSDRERGKRFQEEREARELQELQGCRDRLDVIERELRGGEFTTEGSPKYFLREWDFRSISFLGARENFARIKHAYLNPREPGSTEWMLFPDASENWSDDKAVCALTGMHIVSFYEIDEAEREALRVQ
jgi:hypothetical protein